MEINGPVMSGNIDKIVPALASFQMEVEQPKLNKENPYFKSKYVDLSGVLKTISPALKNNGLSFTQIVNGDDLETLLFHNESGQWLRSIYPLGTLRTSQDRGSAITYGRRYALCAMLGIVADVDDDGNQATDAQKNSPRKNPYGFDPLLDEAIADASGVESMEQFKAVWKKWNDMAPDLCNKGTKFYNILAQKRRDIESKKS